MNSKPHPRHEKNRHHLATAVAAILGTLMFMGIYIVLPQSKWSCVASAILCCLVLFGRTLVIESGYRRPLTGPMAVFEYSFRRWSERWLGIFAVEEHRSNAVRQREATDISGEV